jgi:hypothetical protein
MSYDFWLFCYIEIWLTLLDCLLIENEFLSSYFDLFDVFYVFYVLGRAMLAVSFSMFLIILKSIEFRYCLKALPGSTY